VIRIEAIIPTTLLPEVMEALRDLGCAGCTVTGVRTDILSNVDWTIYRGSVYRRHGSFAAAWRVDVVVSERRLEVALELLTRTIAAGTPGDGRILVAPVSGATRIRTGESGEDAVAL